MRQGTRSAITLSVLALLLVIAAAWGWTATTEPFPGKVDTPLCVHHTVKAGDKVYPQDVTVSVYNSGQRAGLAGRTMQMLTDAGFAEGRSGNVRSRHPVPTAQIWTRDPDNPAVRLVATRLGKRATVERRNPPGVGVAVVVGDGFQGLVKGKRAVVARHEAEICGPSVA